MATRVKRCSKKVEDGKLVFVFKGGNTYTVDPQVFEAALQTQAMLHGFAQKLGDSYSGAESNAEAEEQFLNTLRTLESGEWNSGRAAAGGLLIDAIAQVQGIDRDTALERWNGLDDDQKKAVRAVPRVKAAYAKLQAERAERAAEGSEEDSLDTILK